MLRAAITRNGAEKLGLSPSSGVAPQNEDFSEPVQLSLQRLAQVGVAKVDVVKTYPLAMARRFLRFWCIS
jgi:hypothetical protein